MNYLQNTKSILDHTLCKDATKFELTLEWKWKCADSSPLKSILYIFCQVLSTWFTGPEFLASNNQDYDFEGVKGETLCDEVLIKTVEDQESNVNVSAFSHPEGHVTMHNFLTPL